MVVKGRYRVQIVEAGEKTPFKEHQGEDGKCYAEVEPGAEYFVQVQVSQGDASEFVPVVVDIYVDGIREDINVDGIRQGYHNLVDDEDEIYLNHWEYQEEERIVLQGPFRFERDEGSVTSSSQAGAANVVLGSISVNFFEIIEEGEMIEEGEEANKNSTDITASSAPSASAGMSKMLRSGIGTQSKLKNYTLSNIQEGALLETVTIHYGTVLGLIHADVVDKPPLWDRARLQAPIKEGSVDPVLASLEPEIIKIEATTTRDGSVIKAAVEHSLFDLTDLPDSDDDIDEDGYDEVSDGSTGGTTKHGRFESESDRDNQDKEKKTKHATNEYGFLHFDLFAASHKLSATLDAVVAKSSTKKT